MEGQDYLTMEDMIDEMKIEFVVYDPECDEIIVAYVLVREFGYKNRDDGTIESIEVEFSAFEQDARVVLVCPL